MATTANNLSHYDVSKVPDAEGFTFGIVVSEWNNDITEQLFQGVYKTLLDCGAKPDNITRWNVPGSFELVHGSKRMIDSIDPHVVIAVGSVIKGETHHFTFVCHGVANGIQHLNATGNTPVIFCVLTDNTREQAVQRSGGKLGNKGVEGAITAIKMAALDT